MMLHRHHFTVSGSGVFAFDMLRYDECFPNSQDAVSVLDPPDDLEKYNRARTIELVHIDSRKDWYPTVQRWASFTWRVVPGSYERR